MQDHIQQILIAGMGATGESVRAFMAARRIATRCCDDKSDFPPCDRAALSGAGFVFKSPGLAAAKLRGLAAGARVVNDVELLLRMTLKPVILVTGTNGKTTVVGLVEAMLKANGVHAVACGNNGVAALDAYAARPDVFVIELSSYQLENLSSHRARAAVVLNIGVDHTARHGDMEEYRAVKESIYKHAADAVVPINAAGERGYGRDIVGYRTGETAYAIKDEMIYRGAAAYCRVSDIGLQGRHNHLNVCAALALAHHMELDKRRTTSALRSFAPLPHRLETACVDTLGRRWINDSKSTNLHATAAALQAMREPVVLIMGGRGKGEDYRGLFVEFAETIATLVAFGEDAALIESSAGSIADRHAVATVAEAVNVAAARRDTVLFSPACASFDQYRDFQQRGADFKRRVKRVATCG